jgi:hypothetical protein
MPRSIRYHVWFFCIAGILCLVTPLIAQIDRGTIEGLVKDPSGAVIPGAMVGIPPFGQITTIQGSRKIQINMALDF